ncbi:Uncharacterized membrane protein YeiB [Nonomuraea solani]|uniref:Uncharacterized membrane protein YeiB n=1 Tax=Nonomuraea solani TaxID=1144553 RepID=A0A1H6ER52_9ACTN|nr:DUF418 domain-containing protein [Nonomuraea solani]SEH00337.1 Uncharacterized membrane protein YeiB [Nonomuraea solani]
MSHHPRLVALDVLRGFALCGILVANVRPIANVDAGVVQAAQAARADSLAWIGLFVDQRFFPIFSLLFGIGFTLMLESAARRTARPRLILLRRLLVLLAIGLAHMMLLWRGDILTIYAVVGLAVLLPATWLPRWAVAALAGVLLAVPLVIGSNGIVLVPGLFLLGATLTRYGWIKEGRGAGVPALVFAAGAVPAVWAQAGTSMESPAFGTLFAIAGLLVAGVYVCGMLVLLRTPLQGALRVVFEPLGRMALTNYLSATVLVLAIGGKPGAWSTATVLMIAGAILGIQWVWSTLWLRYFRFGPLEWLWRWATWGRRPALKLAQFA